MKVTIEPDLEEEEGVETRVFTGLQSLAVVGVSYEGGVIRIPMSHSHLGDSLDLLRELPILRYRLEQLQTWQETMVANQVPPDEPDSNKG